MGSNLPSSKTKCKNKSKKGNGEIIAGREKSRDSIGKRKIILPHRFNEFQVELYRPVGSETESEDSTLLPNSPKEMVKFHEETNLKPEDSTLFLKYCSVPMFIVIIRYISNSIKQFNLQHNKPILSSIQSFM
jgi:hypothetical protein